MMETVMEDMRTCREARSNEPASDAGHATMETTTAAATHASFGGRSRGQCTQEDDAGQRYHDPAQHGVSSHFVAKSTSSQVRNESKTFK
jgi:hypothetical protein